MPDDSVIIIGAGLAGLSAGVYAQLNGYRSRIFEHHSQPGGVAAAWKRDGYTIDGGIHFLMGGEPGTAIHRLYTDLGILPACRCVEMNPYAVMIDEALHRRVTVAGDLDRFAEQLKAISPPDAPIIDELINGARAFQAAGVLDFGMDQPPEMVTGLDRVRPMWGMRRVLRYFSGRYAKPVDEFTSGVHDPWVRFVIGNLFLPEVPVWFLCMILGFVASGTNVGLLEEGSLHFAQAIERRYRELGGEVSYQATVAEVLVEGDRAVGVRLADGSEHRAGAVVSAADGHGTLFGLLGGRYVDEKTKQRYTSWPLIRPLLMASFGVAREFPGEPWLQILKLKDPITLGDARIPGFMVRLFNYSPKFAPLGKTVVQAAFETEWDHWEALRQDRPRYEAEKQRVARDLLARLEYLYPGLPAQVEVTDVATPCTTWRYTLNQRGAYMGWLPTPEAIMTSIPRTLPGLRDFYLAGQWVVPGGGVPPSLFSGRHAVQLLCRRDRGAFRTSNALG